MSEDELKANTDTIDNYLAYGWIRPSTGNYVTPAIVIWKNTGQLSTVIDQRQLNKQTRLDSYPIPRIDDLLDRLAHAKYFNKIDLASGLQQKKLGDGCEEIKTAFYIKYSTYKQLILP